MSEATPADPNNQPQPTGESCEAQAPYVVSEQLSKLENEAREWLLANQAPFEERLQKAPRFRVDLTSATLTVGDVLFDDIRARIICSVGIEDPNEHAFYPALRIEGYPDALAAGMRKAANVGPLIDLPEVRAASLPNICPEMIRTFAALCARAADGEAIHVIDADGQRHYLVIGEIEHFDHDHSSMSKDEAGERIAQLVSPVATQLAIAFSPQMMERAPVERVLEQIEIALATADQAVDEIKSCATHCDMIGSDASPVFRKIADDLSSRLDAIVKQADIEVAGAIPLVSDLAIALEGLIATSTASSQEV